MAAATQGGQNLPDGYDVDIHFKPRYNPWDQRLCLIPDADLYAAITEGRAEVVTDHIDHFDATGIALKSGKHLDADIIVTATGLQLQALGGATISLDGARDQPHGPLRLQGAHARRRAQPVLVCRLYQRVLDAAGRHDGTGDCQTAGVHVLPRLHARLARISATSRWPRSPSWDIQAGYVRRAVHALPKSGTKRPWNVRQNYFADAIDYRFDRIEEAMVFGRAVERAPLAGQQAPAIG